MTNFTQAQLTNEERIVVRDSRNGNIIAVIFPSGIQVGLDSKNFNSGVRFPNLTVDPANIKNLLYAKGGTVYFDGNPIGGAPADAQYVVLASNSGLSNEKVLTAGSNITIVDGGGTVTISATGGGTPGGTDTQVQFNDGGSALGGDSGLTYNKTTDTLSGVIIKASTGLSGSLTRLIDGTPYIIAGTNVTITTGSNGAVTISSTGGGTPGGSDTQVQFNDGGSFGGSTGLKYNKTTGALTGTYVLASTGFSGSLTKLTDGSSYLVAGSGIAITTGSNGAVTITNDGTVGDITAVVAGTGLTGGGTSGSVTLAINDSVVATVSGTTFTGVTKHTAGLSGSLTKLTDGTSYLVQGQGISIVTQSNGSVLITGSIPGGSSGEVQFNRNGAFSGSNNLTIDQTGTLRATIMSSNSGSFIYLTGSIVVATTGFSGSLTTLRDGTSYLVQGQGISITTQTNGSVLITGSIPGGSSGQIQFNKNGAFTGSSALTIDQTGTTTATILSSNSGTFNFLTGSIIVATTGFSGSLTRLSNGSPYLLATGGVSATTQSNGSILLSSSIVVPGGSNTQVQFNDGGVFGGSSLFTYDKSVGAVTASYFVGNGANLTNLTASQVYVSGAAQIDGYLQLLPVGNIVIPTNQTASYIYTSGSTNDMYFTQYQPGTGYTNTTRLRWLESILGTGLLKGGVLSTQNGTTTFSITSGSGIIVTQNASLGSDPFPTIVNVSWPTYISQSLNYVTSSQITYVSVDPSGTINQSPNPLTIAERASRIEIGRVLHQYSSVTNGTITSPAISYGLGDREFTFQRIFGPLKVSGHVLAVSSSGGAGTLGLTKTAGDTFSEGRNYTTDPSSPNYVLAANDPALTDCKIFREYLDGSGMPVILTNANAGYTVIDPSQYNVGGALAAVGNSEWTNQRVFWFPKSVNRALFVYYGQQKYSTFDGAIAGISTENFTEGANTQEAAIFIGVVTVKGNETDLSQTTRARISPAGLSRGTGVGGGGGGGGSTSPGGLDTYVQFNDAGGFGGDAGLTYNKATDTLTIGNISIGDTGVESTTGTTITLFNTTATTVNFAGAATSLTMGNSAGTTVISGTIKSPQGLSGSLTQLTDGTSYLIAGTNVTITTGSNGAVTIGTSPAYASSNSYTAAFTNSSLVAGILTVNHGLQAQYLNVSVYDNANKLVIPNEIIATSAGVTTIDLTGFGTLTGTWHVFVSDNSMVTAVSASQYFFSSLAGTMYATSSVAFRDGEVSVTKPSDKGSDIFFYVSGSIGSKGTSTAGTAMFGGDMHVSGSLVVGTGSIKITSNDVQFGSSTTRIEKVGNNLSIVLPAGGNFLVTGTIATSNGGLSGSLTKLSDGTSYLIAGNNTSITTGSNGAVTVTATPGGASGEIQFNRLGAFSGSNNLTIDNTGTLRATIMSSNSGSFTYLTGSVIAATTGLSGSHTKLMDGTSFIVQGQGISVTTQSNGSILITGSVPGGIAGEIQFNRNGVFSGSSALSISQTGTTTATTFSSNSGSFNLLTGSYFKTSYVNSSGSQGYFTLNNTDSTVPFIVLSGTNTKGGAGYFDFLNPINTYAGISAPKKHFRLSNAGNLQVINNAYSAAIFDVDDSGNQRAGLSTVAGNTATTNSLIFNTGSSQGQIFNDGNFHIHANSGYMWISCLDGTSNIALQATTDNAGNYGTVSIGGLPAAIKGGLHITKYVTPSNYAYAAFYNNGGAPGQVWVASSTGPYAVWGDSGRIQAVEFDATSDTRLKKVSGSLDELTALRFIEKIDPIVFQWKGKPEQGDKFGFRAQDVVKAGFANLTTLSPDESVHEEIDEDGFKSPEGASFVMNYDQVVPIHSAVLKHLLKKIDDLEKTVSDLQKRIDAK